MIPSRQLVLTLALAGFGLAAGFVVHRLQSEPGDAVRTISGATALDAGTLLPEPRALPDFSLTGADNVQFTRANLSGRWTLMFFGFTNCPDVCPTTLATLANVVDNLAQSGMTAPDVFFVSVDPGRDTPEIAAGYAAYFNPEFRAVTGDAKSLSDLTRPVGIMYMRVANGDGYTVDHSTAVLLINPATELQAIFSAPHNAEQIAADLRKLLAGG